MNNEAGDVEVSPIFGVSLFLHDQSLRRDTLINGGYAYAWLTDAQWVFGARTLKRLGAWF